MLWTLAAFLVTLSLAIVEFLKTVVNKLKISNVAYPSDAVIDQALPQEIMEHMMTFLDPRAMVECRLVSKYWRHHAIKPNIETEVLARARLRLREVYQELNENGIAIENQTIEELMKSDITNDKLFIRASAIASKHGADLIVAGVDLFHIIGNHENWPKLMKEKKYFVLTNTYKSSYPWHFSLLSQSVTMKPMFDVDKVDWDDTRVYSSVDVLVDPSKIPFDIPLYIYRAPNTQKYFYFAPLDERMVNVWVMIFAPIIVHDILQSSYLSTIKSWFGPIMFICAAIIQLFLIRSLTRNRSLSRSFLITLAVFAIIYLLLTYMAYPASMNVFASIGVMSLMFFYYIIGSDYIRMESHIPLGKKKKQLLIITALLIFLMIDWKLVVMSMADLTFFRTLFDNTIAYNFVLLLFIFYNFLSKVKTYGFDLRYLFSWERHTFMFLRNCYLSVILMTVMAPTWRGNYNN